MKTSSFVYIVPPHTLPCSYQTVCKLDDPPVLTKLSPMLFHSLNLQCNHGVLPPPSTNRHQRHHLGAGFAGLAVTIECDRKGHTPKKLEKASSIEDITRYGYIISSDPNGARNFESWPGVIEAMQKLARQTTWPDLYSWKGEFVTRQSFAEEKSWGPRINGHRGELYGIIHAHAVEGIEVRLGQRVTDYFENEGKAGVNVNGEEMFADVAIAAKGMRSRGRKIVLGFDDKPKSSGYAAAYRSWFSGDAIKENSMLKHLVDGDSHSGFIGPDLHFLVSYLKGGREVNWVFTHVDDGNIE